MLRLKGEKIACERVLAEASYKILNFLQGGSDIYVLKKRGKEAFLDVYTFDVAKLTLKPTANLNVSDKHDFFMAF